MHENLLLSEGGRPTCRLAKLAFSLTKPNVFYSICSICAWSSFTFSVFRALRASWNSL